MVLTTDQNEQANLVFQSQQAANADTSIDFHSTGNFHLKDQQQDIYVDVSIDHEDLFEGARKVVQLMFPSWASDSLSFKQYTDGITNKLVRCYYETEDTYVLIRVFGKNSEILINRKQEILNIKALSKNKLCPDLKGRFQNGFVYGYIPGRPLTVEEVSDEEIFPKVARKLAQFHKTPLNIEKTPQLFVTLDKWISTIPERYSKKEVDEKFKETISIQILREELDILKRELNALNSPIVFAHNDLLSPNIIQEEDIEKVSFIDFEYACYNYRGFDIGNHFCEFAGFDCDYTRYPDEKIQKQWLKNYLFASNQQEPSESDIHQLYREVNKFALAAHLYWSIWALVQANISDIDFNYLDYALMRLGEYFKRKEHFLAL